MAKFILLKVIEEPSDNAGGCLGALAVIGFAIYFIISGIGSCITDREVYSYNSELVEKTIKDTNALINSKERLTLEQCLVYVQFETECIIDDNFNYIPQKIDGTCRPGLDAIKETCSTQKNAIHCENDYELYCDHCNFNDYYKCWIEDNSLLIKSNHIPCSKELKNSWNQTILTHCTEFVYNECIKSNNSCKDPFLYGSEIENDDGEKEHWDLGYFSSSSAMSNLYKKLTGRKLN